MPRRRDVGVVGDAGRGSPREASAMEILPVVRAAERFVEGVEGRYIALMLDMELTMTQLRALMPIRRLGRAHGRQLAATLGVTPGAIVAICDHLEHSGYVRGGTDTRDRRITWFEVTEQGGVGLHSDPAPALHR